MRFLKKTAGKTSMDKIRNTTFRETLGTNPVLTTIEQEQLRWLGHG